MLPAAPCRNRHWRPSALRQGGGRRREIGADIGALAPQGDGMAGVVEQGGQGTAVEAIDAQDGHARIDGAGSEFWPRMICPSAVRSRRLMPIVPHLPEAQPTGHTRRGRSPRRPRAGEPDWRGMARPGAPARSVPGSVNGP